MNKFFYDKRIICIYIITIIIIFLGIAYALKEVSYAFNVNTDVYGIDETAYGNTHFNSANLDLKPILDSDVTTKTDNVIKIDFTIGGSNGNPNDQDIIYDIALTDLDVDCDLLSQYMKWKLVKDGEEISSGNLSNSFDTIIDNRLVLTNTQVDLPDYSSSQSNYDNYSFYLWLSDSCQSSNLSECFNSEDQSSLLGKSLSGKIEVELNTGVKKTNNKHPTEGDACSNIQKVFFDPKGGEVNISSKEIVNGETYGALPTPTREDYAFDGWYLDEEYNVEINENSIVNTSGNIILYAKWKIKTYNVTYDYSTNGGTSATKTTDSLTYGSVIDLTPVATKSGWTFVGWNTDKDATTKLDSLIMSKSDITLYAIYRKEAITYTATTQKNIDSATGTGTSVSCTIAAVYNRETQATSCEVTLPSNPYTLTNWTFNGWVNAGSSTTTTTTSGVAVSNRMSISSNINIVATWKKTVAVKLTFDKNGGSDNTTSAGVDTTLYNGNTSLSATLTFTAPSCTTYSGWTCLGYSTSATATSSSWDVGATKSIAVSGTVPIGDTTFTKASGYYHIWKKTATATWYYYNGSAQTSTTTSCNMYNSATSCNFSLPSAVSGSSGPNSSTYNGVSTSVSSSTTTTSYTSSNTKYYAVYTKSVTATFYYNSNTTAGSLTVSTTTSSGTRYYISNDTDSRVLEGSISVPSDVSNSVGKYNTSYHGLSKTTGNMTKATVDTSSTTYYALYSSPLTIYYPSSSTACSNSSTVAYRNEWFKSTTETNQVIGSNNGETSDITTISGIYGTFAGLASSVNSISYVSVSSSAATSRTTFYAVSTTSVGVTFYYYYDSLDAVTFTGHRTFYCSSTAAATVKEENIAIPDYVKGNVTKDGNTYTYRGVTGSSSATIPASNATVTSTATTAYQNWYASYSNSITITYNLNGGSGTTPSNGTGTTYMNCEGTVTGASITMPSGSGITKANYVFDGWNTSTAGSGTNYTAGTSYTFTTSTTLYAKWQAANYEVSGGGKTTDYFITLTEAHKYAADTGSTIKVLQNVTESATGISKSLTLNTNSKIMTMNGAISVSSGTLTINGSGTLNNYASGKQNIIYLNGGSTSLSSVTLSESGSTNTYDLISNAGGGSVTLASVTANISTANSVVYCSTASTGAVTINSGTYNANAQSVIHNYGSGTTTIAGGTLTVTSGTAIALTGSATLNVTGGTINNGSSGHAIIESGSGNINLSGGTLSGTSSSSSNVIYMSENSSGTLTVKGATIRSVSTTNYAISIKRDSGPSFSMTSGTITCNASGGCLRGYVTEGTNGSGTFTISGGTISSSSGGTAGSDYLIGLAAAGATNDKISGGVIANYATGGAVNCSKGDYDYCVLRIQGGTMYAASNSGYGAVRVNESTEVYIGYSTARILAKSAYALYVLGGGWAYINYNSASGSGLAYNAGAVLLSTGAAAVYVTNNSANIVHLGTRTYAYKASDGSSVPAPRVITGSSSAYTIQCGSSATCTFRGGRTYANSTTVSHLNSGFTTYSNASGTYKTSTSASGTLSYGSGSYAVTASYKARGYYGT